MHFYISHNQILKNTVFMGKQPVFAKNKNSFPHLWEIKNAVSHRQFYENRKY